MLSAMLIVNSGTNATFLRSHICMYVYTKPSLAKKLICHFKDNYHFIVSVITNKIFLLNHMHFNFYCFNKGVRRCLKNKLGTLVILANQLIETSFNRTMRYSFATMTTRQISRTFNRIELKIVVIP